LDARFWKRADVEGWVTDVRFWHFSDKPTATKFVAYWTNIRQGPAHGLIGSVLNDPRHTFSCPNIFVADVPTSQPGTF